MLGKEIYKDRLILSMLKSNMREEIDKFLNSDENRGNNWQKFGLEKLKKWGENLFGDKYDYSNLRIEDNKLIVLCRNCNSEFSTRFSDHFSKHNIGCPNCKTSRASKKNSAKLTGVKREKNKEKFIAKSKSLFGDTYSYDKVDYKGYMSPVIIICKEHGEFTITPNSHLRGYGCPECGGKRRRIDTEEFIERSKRIHGDKYVYNKTEFKGLTANVIITCKKHGDFKQRPSNHLFKAAGCPACAEELRKERVKKEYRTKRTS